MRLYFEKRVLFGFFCALTIIVGLGVYSYFNNQQFAQTSSLVGHTNKVLFHSEKLLTLILDVEASQRGYIATGDSTFLEAYTRTLPVVDDHMKELVSLTSDNSRQQQRLAQLDPLIADKLAFTRQTILLRNSSFRQARDTLMSMTGLNLVDEIKKLISEVQAEENELLQVRMEESDARFQKSTYAFSGLLIATAAILIGVFTTINFSLRARAKAERSLRIAADEIRDIYDHAPCGYHSVDSTGTVVEANATMLAWLGYEKNEVVCKMKVAQLLVPESVETFQKNFAILKERGYVNGIEFEFNRKDGSTFHTILSSTAIHDGDGNYLRSRSTVFDITDRRIAENRIKQLNHELEAFTYSVSHDLRAPLRSIDGYTKILEEDYASKLDDEGRRVMKIIMNNAKKMGNLIDDLLEFSRLGRKDLAKSECDMDLIVKNILTDQLEHERRQINVTVDNLLPCSADFPMIRQVWVNLISNAIKYTQKTKDPVIEIRSYVDRGNTVYSVRDNGVGFDMKYIGKLFGVFQRLHKVEDFEGTGVGLAIVYRIISKHGGRVWAEGVMNEGAVFFFSLPGKINGSGGNRAASDKNVNANKVNVEL